MCSAPGGRRTRRRFLNTPGTPPWGPPPAGPVHKDEADSLNILRTVLMKENTWAVTIKGSDEPVGSIGYFPSDGSASKGEPEIGYWIGVPFWGRGYIPEAVKALIARCFSEGAARGLCAHFEGNEKVPPGDRKMRLPLPFF